MQLPHIPPEVIERLFLQMKETMEFYSNPKNYAAHTDERGQTLYPIHIDAGGKARKMLQAFADANLEIEHAGAGHA
jgi:hypothetical protein